MKYVSKNRRAVGKKVKLFQACIDVRITFALDYINKMMGVDPSGVKLVYVIHIGVVAKFLHCQVKLM